MDMATLTVVFGVLGNIVSFVAFLAPIPTFYKIYKNKSAEGFQSLPYLIALLSSMLWMYYALIHEGVVLLITINSFGCVIETIYISLFIFYAPKKFKIQTVKILLLLNVFGYGLMILLTTLLTKGERRRLVVGLICLAFNIGVFAAPFSTMRQVIKTRSVEFMPFLLSFFITLGAIMWFFYGFLAKDFYIALPNILGFFLGIGQMILYFMYKNATSVIVVHEDQPELELV
ncbi:bidirectional sugar transporter SWEET14-like [Cannabis sativa]|uniref:Bidirectional sugar transporter SWEET n=1 Tax=Cannabis sativa TaxID=3483 RepID=A0A7J6H9T8_CANSA|nr:bidirectional sugar transporter SWEET14-like [Cannabis sativa]KAF4371483.1 hypothetical protein F8388_002011 [Cannabis sativa]KAF4391875.1 hypothetical protein G4B88_007450 [Cannabis sativa]